MTSRDLQGIITACECGHTKIEVIEKKARMKHEDAMHIALL